jgi:two-component system, chemotaxis family, sensor kinase CheA
VPEPGTVEVDLLDVFLDEAVETLQTWEELCLKLERQSRQDHWDALARAAHNLKGSSTTFGLVELGALFHKIEDMMAPLKEGKIKLNPARLAVLLAGQECARAWVEQLRQDPYYVCDVTDYLRQLDRATREDELPSSNDPVVEAKPPKSVRGVMPQVPPAPQVIIAAPASQAVPVTQVEPDSNSHQGKKKGGENIRVASDKLDALVGAISELSVCNLMLTHHVESGTLDSPAAMETVHQLAKVARELQDLALVVRLQQVGPLFQRLERTARDVARAQQKPLNVVRIGDHVELDKAILDRVGDPLMHVLRNAVDHGIEAAGTRVARGKSATATVTIEARQEPNGVTIVVSDDGQGLNLQRIREKAIEKGIIPAGVELPREEIFRLILRPNFSTAAAVTSTSGRGVGMDVLKQAIDEMGGTLDIDSTEGQGTSFLVSLPAGLSLIEALVVKVNGGTYVVPANDVAEVLDVRERQIIPRTYCHGVFEHRQQAVPLYEFGELLPIEAGLAPVQIADDELPTEEQPPRPTIITKRGRQLFAFEVDGLGSMQTVVVRELDEKLAEHRHFAGGVILGDGCPALVVNMQRIMDRVSESMLKEARSA